MRGPAGIGKSWLVARALAEHTAAADASDTLVLQACGHLAERELPFAGLHQLLLPVHAAVDALAEPQRAAIARSLAQEPMAGRHRFETAVGLHALLSSLSVDRPVVVVVDDAQWLDTSTTSSLVFAVRRLDADPVAVVLVTRDPDRPEGLDAEEITLAPLDDMSARQLALTEHPDLAVGVADSFVRAAGGLPVVLCEGPADLTPGQRRGEEALPAVVPLGTTLSWLYRRRLDELGPNGRLALLVASLERLDARRLGVALASLGLSPSDLHDVEAAGLVDLSGDIAELGHATVAAAVQSASGSASRRRARRAIADALADQPLRQVWFLDAPAGGDEDLASCWDAAADDAERRGAWSEAAVARESAARCSPAAADRRRRLGAVAAAHARAGAPGPLARVLGELIATVSDADERLLLEAQLITARAWATPSPVDTRAARELISETPGSSPAARAHLLTTVGFTALLWGDHDSALLAVDAAARARERDEAPLSERLIGDLVGVVAGRPGAGRFVRGNWLDGLSDAELVGPDVPAFLAAFVLGLIDEDDHARRITERLRDAAAGIADVSQMAIATALVGAADERRGDMLAARAHYSTAAQLCRDTDFLAPLAHFQARHAYLLAGLGLEERCRAVVAEARAAGSPVMAHLAACALGLLELTLGNCERAVEHLQRATDTAAPTGLGEPNFSTHVGDLVEALWRLRRSDEAALALEPFAAAASRLGRRSSSAIAWRGRGLLCPDAEIDDHFAAAHEHHDAAGPNRFQQARTDLCWGMRLRRARRKRDARVPLRRALSAFETMGASRWATTAANELTACGERRRTAWTAVDELTPRELEVAVLVADGATNPAAAAALFISVRTVEDHLTRVYRKLGLGGRGELATALARPQPAAATN